jgi:hypothetical protein
MGVARGQTMTEPRLMAVKVAPVVTCGPEVEAEGGVRSALKVTLWARADVARRMMARRPRRREASPGRANARRMEGRQIVMQGSCSEAVKFACG